MIAQKPASEEPVILRVCKAVHPCLLTASLNCVSTDAVATAIMGFDPMADPGTAPFQKCDSTLRLAEHGGVGTREVSRIDAPGTPNSKARFPFPPLGHYAV